MDKNEAVGVLKTLQDFNDSDYIKEALEMSIKSLQTSESTQKAPNSQSGFGNCSDCSWLNDPEGCNAERGSSTCILNKRPRKNKKNDKILQAADDIIKIIDFRNTGWLSTERAKVVKILKKLVEETPANTDTNMPLFIQEAYKKFEENSK